MKKIELCKAELTRVISYILLRDKVEKNACYFNNKSAIRRAYFILLLKKKYIEIVKVTKILEKRIIFIKPTSKLSNFKFDANQIKKNE